MIEKGKISSLQMAILMYPTILATAILLVPAITARHAERDMWLSPIWASLIGFLTVYIAYRLNRIYPKETIIEYGEHILGRISGKAIGLVFLFFYLHTSGIILREYGEFINGKFLLRTPMIVTIGSMMLVTAFAVRSGVEVLGRISQIFVPINILLLVLLNLLLFPELKTKHMLPVMEKGIMPSVMGAVTPQSWFSEFFLASFLYPFLTDREKGMKWGMISVLAVMLTMVVTNIFTLLLFGEITASLTFPVMESSRYISIADFLEHIEAVVMAIWVTGTFLKISVFYYALSLGTAQWLNLSDYRPVVLPLGFLLVVFSIWSAPNLSELSHFLGTSCSFYLSSVQTGIPVFLLLIATLRKGKRSGMEGRKR
ncbi:GerAB/ArcD/ProY family transporter [Effusibacillus lacus]|uniref:Spore gernimation protein n=1 Tax=Effusibacillus lacus TaxID=1348429 RepID=A0A292YN81_9BACL|nr:endospore germination permease [Effusibacillus lacus]TCS76098.1 spore germination protein KB [Effusibacillus lacus]GAX91388.1 spore gernimation protein [Effusibacillus lacus]